MEEWADRIHSICRLLHRKIALGGKVEATLASMAKRFNGTPFKSDPARKLKLSSSTLARLFYTWLKLGRRRRAICLHYKAPVKLRGRDLAALGAVILSPGTRSLVAAVARLPRRVASYDGYRAALPSGLRAASAGLFRARRELRSCRRQIAAGMLRLSRKGDA